MLTFPIKRKWQNMIRSGDKKEEYRAISPYYDARLGPFLGREITVRLRAGYARTSPTVEVTALVVKGEGRPEWGATPGVKYYVLKIREVKDVETEFFVLEARKCKRCGGILTSAKAVRNGFGHTCLMRTRAEQKAKEIQITLFDE